MSVSAVIISDVHHDTYSLRRLLPIINASDYFVFCGDGISDVMTVIGEITANSVCVRGNCDFGSIVSDRASLRMGKTDVFVTHGHLYGVKQSVRDLADIAKERGCGIVFFGHTHSYTDLEIDGVRMINPGALCEGSYAYLTIDGDDIVCEQRSI